MDEASFDESMIAELRAVGQLLHGDQAAYSHRQHELAESFAGRERALEDILYDFDEPAARLEGLMICKLMPGIDRKRIYEDLALAEPDPEIRKWAAVLARQERLIEIATGFGRDENL